MLLPTKRRVGRRSQRNQRAAALGCRRLAVEPLEPRRLLAADGAIAGVKWLDADGDGQRGADEHGLAGVAIYLDANEDGHFDPRTERSTTTGDGGRYVFRRLEAGLYTVAEVLPRGWEQTFPSDGVHKVKLEEGDVVDGLNFGNRRAEIETGSIHGRKWGDTNGNGRHDDGEPGLAGVTIYSDLNLNGRLDDGEPSAVSMEDDPNTAVDESGAYWLENLRPGQHVIREVVPDGFEQTFPHSLVRPAGDPDGLPGDEFFTVNPEQIDVDLEAGDRFETRVSLTIHPLCFRPYDVDVVATDPDVNFTNHTGIVLNGCGGDTSSFSVSMVGDGRPHMFDLQFIDTKFGNSVIAEIPVQINGASRGGAHLVFLEAGDAVEDINFGNRLIDRDPSSVHGVKWLDENANGQQDNGEPGLPGVTIYSDLNHNGQFDAGEPSAVSMQDNPLTDFDEAGMYWLEGLSPGRHIIREIAPDGFVQTFPREGHGHEVSLDPNQSVDGVNFGNRPETKLASIRGLKFLDRNGDGEQDDDEPGLGGVTIFLDLNNDGLFNRGEPGTTTAGIGPLPGAPNLSVGEYSFDNLEPAEYIVREIVPEGWEQTFPHEAAHVVQAASGERVTGIDFGNRPIEVTPGSIQGRKWHDVDGDGEQGRQEPGLGGVTIYLDLNRNGALDDAEPHTVTMRDNPDTDFDEGGLYRFDEVKPGEYVVREVLQEGWVQTFPANGRPQVVEVRSGSGVDDVNFGNWQPQGTLHGAIVGRKWWDRNGNGEHEASEIWLAGFTIYLDTNGNGELDVDEPRTETARDNPNTRFDESGRYSFENLAPGVYLVREVQRRDWQQTFPREGAAHEVKLDAGDIADGIHFGNRRMGGPPEDLTADGWVDFNDLTLLLANWNRRGTELDGNFVLPDTTPINFDDLTTLLAAWTGPGPAVAPSPQAAVGRSRLSATQETTTVVDSVAPQPAAAYFDRLGRREARRDQTTSALRRLQSAAVDRAIEIGEEAAPRRRLAARRR